MTGYRIITARPEHLARLGQVEREAATVFPPGSIPDEIRADEVSLEVLAEAQEAGRLWVAVPSCGCNEAACNGGASGGPDSPAGNAPGPVGFALMRICGDIALLAQMDVLPAHARKGLGRGLIRQAAARAWAQGFPALYLTTFAHIPWNAPFYARLGFQALERNGLPPVLQEILESERKMGLRNRLAMRLDLSGDNFEI